MLADHLTGRNLDAAYHGSKLATKLKVMGVELASMGITEPADDDDEVVQFTEPKRGIYKKLIVRDGRLVGGILLGDISKAAYLMQAFDRDTPLPEERAVAALRHRRAVRRRSPVTRCPTRRRSATATASPRARSPRASRGGKRSVQGGDGRDPRRHGLRLVQGAGAASSSSGSAAARSRRIRPSTTTCRACR